MAVVFTALTLAVGVSTWAFLGAQIPSRYGAAFDLYVHDQYGHGGHCLAGSGGGDGAYHAAPRAAQSTERGAGALAEAPYEKQTPASDCRGFFFLTQNFPARML